MTFDDYQKLAIRTVNVKLTIKERLDMLSLGLSGESGECAEIVKKWRYHSHPLDENKLSKEIGDVCWYCACLAETLKISLSDCARLGVEWMNTELACSNNVSDFHQVVEQWTANTEKVAQDHRPDLISSVTHQLCDACGSLSSAVVCDEGESSIQRGLADVLLTVSQYATVLSIPLDRILRENVEKLQARYPEGFSEEASRNRRD